MANYMGHAEKIHKDIYRQPLVNREILRMSKLLEVAQGANTELNDEDDDTDLGDEELEHDSEDNDIRSSHDDIIRNHQENSLDSKGLNRSKLKGSGKGKRFSKLIILDKVEVLLVGKLHPLIHFKIILTFVS